MEQKKEKKRERKWKRGKDKVVEEKRMKNRKRKILCANKKTYKY